MNVFEMISSFWPRSMFGSVELDGLNPHRVDYVNIKVVANLEGPFMWGLKQPAYHVQKYNLL